MMNSAEQTAARPGSFGFNLSLVVLALVAVEGFVFSAVMDRTVGSLSTLRLPGFGQRDHQGDLAGERMRPDPVHPFGQARCHGSMCLTSAASI